MISTELHRQGNFLFRYRSFVPILIVVPLGTALMRLTPAADMSQTLSWWAALCFGISISGLLLRALTVGFVPGGTSGRNTKQQRAMELNTTGLYSVVRHPLYVGNFLIWLGIVLTVSDFAVVALFVCAYSLYYERIMAAEELFLTEKFGADYETWARVTPAFLPRFSQWKRSQLKFSIKTVLRREYCAVLGITFAFAAIDLAKHIMVEGRLLIEFRWLAILLAGVVTFVVLRTLKKKTRCLHIEGR